MLSPTQVARRAVSSAAASARALRPRASGLGQLGGDGRTTGRRTARRTLMSSSGEHHQRPLRMPDNTPWLRYTTPDFPDEPVTLAWTADAIFVRLGAPAHVRRLSPTTLRDSCVCARCRDPDSGNKTYQSTELPDELAIADVEPAGSGLAVTFAHDVPRLADDDGLHRTLVPWAAVEVALGRARAREPDGDVLFPRRRAVAMQTGVRYWDRAVLDDEVRSIDFADYMHGGSAFWDAVIDLCRLGIVFLRNVPRAERSVVDVATRIANVRETLYGRTFDVRAKPAADNVAYTGAALGLHQDLLYLDAPPMVQVLHCVDNSCVGGESLFSDGARAAHLLWPFVRASPRLAPLQHHHVPYRCAKPGFRYHAQRPVLAAAAGSGPGPGLPDLFWSPPFQAPHDYAALDLRPWVDAARVLQGVFSADAAVYRRKLQPGECVLFDNLRVLHGRTAFDPADAAGSRWLRGAYIAADDFLSRAAHMPLDQAHALRGPVPWTPQVASQKLRLSPWHAALRDVVCEFDPAVARRFVR